MRFSKIAAAVSSLVIASGMAAYAPQQNTVTNANAEASSNYNYAEALQKSMFFYEVQQAGELPEWNEVSWRADSMLKEDGTDADVIPGGWFDAGDHLKFTLTNAYTASVLAWGLIEYEDAVKEVGLYESYLQNLKWGLDYVAACDLGDSVIGTIGDDAFDHVWYGSPEVYIRKFNLKSGSEDRPYDTITCTTTVAEMAAALAGGYIIFKDSDPETANNYLEHAVSLFELANETWSNDDMGVQEKYYSTKHNSGTDNFVDELFYAANWMYMATGDQAYLDKCESDYIPIFPLENQSTSRKYTWGFCWDDTTQAAALLYAQNTGKQEWIDHVSHHLDYWMDGYGGKVVNKTPDGLSHLDQWGSLRYAANTSWIAFLACDTIFADDAALCEKYNTWAKSQMDYAFGDNDLGLSYVVGMGEKNPVNIHHRGASGIYDDHWNQLGEEPSEGEYWQTEYAHVLYGALEGGPNQDGSFNDSNGSYTNTEVAIDYNAGWTAALCAMVEDYGGEILADFPPTEEPKWAEWEIAATLNGSGNSYTEIKAWAMNHTAWPARVEKNISYRYYFDVSEVLAAGLSVDDITVKSNSQQYQEGQQGYATVTGPYKYEGDASGNTYYALIQFEDGRAIQPTGQSEHRDEVQFRISIPDAINGQSTAGAWDPTNDWSYESIPDAPNNLLADEALNDHITMYVDNVLVWGTEPDGTTPDDVQPSTDPTTEPTTAPTTEADDDILYGDANLSGVVEISDAVKIMSYVTDKEKYPLSDAEMNVADVYQRGDGISNMDALAVQKKLAQLITGLPESTYVTT
ncbi:MAG: glycoside hydrolase family 9 protein [Ruminococcus sp.]|nr:glycoside hydrolase family 9 protein [Ruminococcus sp.]